MKIALCCSTHIRNLDVKLQLGHPLLLITLDLTMISINSYWVGQVRQLQFVLASLGGGAHTDNYGPANLNIDILHKCYV